MRLDYGTIPSSGAAGQRQAKGWNMGPRGPFPVLRHKTGITSPHFLDLQFQDKEEISKCVWYWETLEKSYTRSRLRETFHSLLV
jgi:hypothetical protein